MFNYCTTTILSFIVSRELCFLFPCDYVCHQAFACHTWSICCHGTHGYRAKTDWTKGKVRFHCLQCLKQSTGPSGWRILLLVLKLKGWLFCHVLLWSKWPSDGTRETKTYSIIHVQMYDPCNVLWEAATWGLSFIIQEGKKTRANLPPRCSTLREHFIPLSLVNAVSTDSRIWE